MLRALGAEAVSIPFAEVYTALERGTVDAAMTGTYSGFALTWYEVSKYLVDINHGPAGGLLIVSKRSWDQLTPEQRVIVRRLGEEFSERGWEIGRKTTRDGIEGNTRNGMEWIPATPARVRAVRDVATRTVVPSWVKRGGPDARAIFSEYIGSYAGFTVP